MADNKGTLNVVQDLIVTCRNGQNGYTHAAAKVKSADLKSFFLEQSRERGRFAVELTEASKKLGKVRGEKKGSVVGVLHRAWFTLKADFGSGDQGILSSVEQGEDRAKQSYEQALASGLNEELRIIVQQQFESIKNAHERVRKWRGPKAA